MIGRAGAVAITENRRLRRRLAWRAGALAVVTLAAGAFLAAAQDQAPAAAATVDGNAPQASSPPLTVDTARVPVRGVVRNSQTGQGVARALVRIEGDAAMGMLTDGDGRFEFRDVPVGPQSFTVNRPGYQDRPFGAAATDANASGQWSEDSPGVAGHNVIVAEGMAELAFTLAPASALHGQVVTATGEPAAGMNVELAHRTIEGGRAVWQMQAQMKTRSDGSFRFGGLAEGQYTVFTDPAEEQDGGNDADASQSLAFPTVYYPDAREPGSAGRIALAQGGDAQVNLTLAAEPFHRVTVTVVGKAQAYSASLADSAGRTLPYTAKYDASKHALEAMLPDGSYQMLVTTLQAEERALHAPESPQVGVLEFTVAGKPLELRVTPVAQHSIPIDVMLLAGSPSQSDAIRNNQIVLLASPATGWLDDGVAMAFASGPVGAPLEAVHTAPGAYWLHAQIPQKGLCEGSLTAGGANLATEPLRLDATAPLALAVRRDCAQLTLVLPATAMFTGAGEEPYYTAWVVPDFDFTQELSPVTLRPSSGQTVALESLTPGGYHIYVFKGPYTLEYRNREALAALHGQTIALGPGATEQLVVEVPAP